MSLPGRQHNFGLLYAAAVRRNPDLAVLTLELCGIGSKCRFSPIPSLTASVHGGACNVVQQQQHACSCGSGGCLHRRVLAVYENRSCRGCV